MEINCERTDLTPIERWGCYVEGIGNFEMGWTLLALILFPIVGYAANINIVRDKFSTKTITYWLAGGGFLTALLILFGWQKITETHYYLGPISFIFSIVIAWVFMFFVVAKSDKEDKTILLDVTTSSIVVLVLVGLFVAFGRGASNVSFGIFFGFLIGICTGMYVTIIRHALKANNKINNSKLEKTPKKEGEEKNDDWSNRKPNIKDR